jgi:hypothetical protein
VLLPENNRDVDYALFFGTAVVWKKNVFELIRGETLDDESYEHEVNLHKVLKKDTIKTMGKNATWVQLREIADPEETTSVTSVHLPGDGTKRNGSEVKEDLMRYIMDKKMEEKKETKYTVLGGDFNCPMAQIKGCSLWVESFLTKEGFKKIQQPSNVTTCSYDYGANHAAELIDTLFYDPQSLVFTQYQQESLDCAKDKDIYSYTNDGYSNVTRGSDHGWILSTFKKKSLL